MIDPLETSLRTLPSEDLADLIVRRASFDGDFLLWVETELAAKNAQQTGDLLDPEPFRRRAQALLAAVGQDRTRHRRWDRHGSDIDEAEFAALIEQAEPFLAAGDGPNAMAILVPVAQALAESWPECAEWDETLHEFFPQLDRMMAQAVLMEGISTQVREELAERLSDWQDQVADYGAEEAFAVAIMAASRGWDEPGLDDVLHGRGANWPTDATSDWSESALVQARLAALEAMGRTDEYLRLAKATGRTGEVCVMLVKCGRSDEAIALARTGLHDPGPAHRLAQALWDAGRHEAAFDLAAWALALPRDRSTSADRYALACWLRTEAEARRRLDLAVLAARAAFEEFHSLEDYRAVANLCDPRTWPSLRAELLSGLLNAAYAPDRIDILLGEGMIEEAISVVDRQEAGLHSPFNDALKRLVRAASQTHGDWVIHLCMSMATPIMVEGRSNHYDLAVEWLELAGRAYEDLDKWDEWMSTLDTVIETHRRKHKLRRALMALHAGR
jgi:uncharacterized Zn finger protein